MNVPRTVFAALGFWLCLAAVVLAFLWHISVGAKAIPLETVWQALVAPLDGVFDHVVVRELRLPRAIFALSVGAALAVAGALMQGVTRNALAEPAILGLMAGATFAVVVGIGWFQLAGTAYVPLFAAIGALIGAGLVWTIAGAAPGGATPLTLILSGAAVGGFLHAVESALILLNEDTFRDFRIWLSGSLAGRDMATYFWALPWFVVGLGAALVIARQITALAMGEETAAGLGINTVRIKIGARAAVIALTAAVIVLLSGRRAAGRIAHGVRTFRVAAVLAVVVPLVVTPLFRFVLLVRLPNEGGIVDLMGLIYFRLR